MAIVRTTSRETGTTGAAPPAVKPAGVVQRPDARGVTQRGVQPARPVNAVQFFSDIKTELKRVVWPSRQEVQAGTIVTVGLLIFFALFISGLNAIFDQLLKAIISP